MPETESTRPRARRSYDPFPEAARHYRIGGLVLRIERDESGPRQLLPASYRPFRAPELSGSDLLVRTHPDLDPPPAGGEVVFSILPLWRLVREGSGARRYEGPVRDGTIFRTLRVSREASRADLYTSPLWRNHLEDHPARETVLSALFDDPIDQLLFIDRLAADCSGLIVHGASAVKGERAFLFAAVSGGGKTTLCRGVRQARVLTDDRTILRRGPGGIEAHGSPWYGEAGLKSAGSAPLAHVYLLDRKGPRGVREADREEAYRLLLHLAFPTYWDREGLEFAMDLLDSLVRDVPVEWLSFDPGEDVFTRISG